MALQWTHENISYFGADASNISVGGYSAGAHSVFHQLAYDLGVPDNKAVIKRALMLSNGPGMQPKSLEETELQLEELLAILGISKALTPAEQLENLCNTEARTLIQATHKMVLHQFRAVTDGVFVRQGLMDELDQGTFARRMQHRGVQLIIGECSDEHYVYGTWRPPKPGFDNMLHRLEADYPRDACKVLAAQYFPNRKLPSKYRNWQAAFGHIYADVQIHALGRGMVSALIKHGAGDLVHRYRIEWRAKCVDKKYPVAWGATHSADMAMWFWGNGESLTEEEKTLVTKAFHEPLGMFIRGEKMDWGTEHAMQIRTLRADGTIAIEDDTRLEEGLMLWNALERVRSAGHSHQSKL
jgi:carboxylesterase type B